MTLLAASATTAAATDHTAGNGGMLGEDAQDSLATKPSVFCDVFINKYLVPNRQEGNRPTYLYCILLYKYTSTIYILLYSLFFSTCTFIVSTIDVSTQMYVYCVNYRYMYAAL